MPTASFAGIQQNNTHENDCR